MKKIVHMAVIKTVLLLIFYGCSSSEKTPQIKMPSTETVSPGSAITQCLIQGIEEKGDSYSLTVLIKQVYGYGSNTESIAPDSELQIQMKKNMVERKSLFKSALLNLELQQPIGGMGVDQGNTWRVVQIIN